MELGSEPAVHHVFKESSCCLCGRSGVDQYLEIANNFIKYDKKLICFAEVIRTTLCFDPSQITRSLEICFLCKAKLVEFYHFKMKSEKVRLSQHETDLSSSSQEVELDEVQNETNETVYTTLQIVREFMASHLIAEINVDESNEQLIIKSIKSIEPGVEGYEKEEDNEAILEQDRLKEEELVTSAEYLEDCTMEEFNAASQTDNQAEILFDFANSDDSNDNQLNSESASDSKPPSNPRRPRHPESWACNQRKSLRNSGQMYLNSKGKIVEAKRMKESCGEHCRSKCITRISEDDRLKMFENYWGFGDVVKQRKFIYEHITTAEPKRRRSQASNRTVTLQFYLEAQDEEGTYALVQVCKKMFKNTLVISSQVIQGVVKKYSLEGFNDSRGKFKRKLTVAQQIATEHVKQFPFFYIEQTMTKVQCYQEYCKECMNQGVEPVKEGNYRDIFDRQNQGNFLKTQRVSCEACHQYYRATDEERELLQQNHDIHISLSNNKKCRDRALGRIRHKRAQERKRMQRLAVTSPN